MIIRILGFFALVGMGGSLAGCATFNSEEIGVAPTPMPGGKGAVIRVAATAKTPGAVFLVSPNQTVASVGGNGLMGDVLHAIPSVTVNAPIAGAAALTAVNAQAVVH